MEKLSRSAMSAAYKYGVAACVECFRLNRQEGFGPAGIVKGCHLPDSGLVITNVAACDAAINAGAEIVKHAAEYCALEPGAKSVNLEGGYVVSRDGRVERRAS